MTLYDLGALEELIRGRSRSPDSLLGSGGQQVMKYFLDETLLPWPLNAVPWDKPKIAIDVTRTTEQ